MPTDSPEFGRGVSFFDAIYGFAITLLVANVDPLPPEAWQSVDAFLGSGVPIQLLGFALSFVVIAVFWRTNVRLMRRLTGMDSATITLNLVATGLVVLIPFTTQGISDPHTSALPLPTAVYALNIALVSLAQSAVYQVARSRGLERVPSGARENRWELSDAMVTPAVFLLSIPLALLFGDVVAKSSWASLLILGPLSGTLRARAKARNWAPR